MERRCGKTRRWVSSVQLSRHALEPGCVHDRVENYMEALVLMKPVQDLQKPCCALVGLGNPGFMPAEGLPTPLKVPVAGPHAGPHLLTRYCI
jgi:hypothetical protein